jgi:deoxyribodipyrimidine photo-lyase
MGRIVAGVGVVLPRQSGSRETKAQSLARHFKGLYLEEVGDCRPSEFVGGRGWALEAWEKFSLKGYAARRNHCSADEHNVSRLSPYIRHGVLNLREVAQWTRERCPRGEDRSKFWAELGWRQFWQIVWRRWGAGIYQDIEPPKVPLGSLEELPEDVSAGRTGLPCMDAFIRELVTTGWLHNHARMWLASYLVHFRKIRWQAGERFFYRHLLDGDPASNALSWQWVASTFAPKPYIFNRDNLEKHTGGRYCAECRVDCPFRGTYEEISLRLFSGMEGRGS